MPHFKRTEPATRVVIVGAGFGGVAAARALKDAAVGRQRADPAIAVLRKSLFW